MIFTWIKYGKPDVSMSLNASLAGLVAITAPCDVADAFGAVVIGFVAGLLVCFGVWLLDEKLRIDDPVGAVAVHMMNGIWGTFAVGLFATETAPGFAVAGIEEGLFYGGGFHQLWLQCVGIVSVAAWAAVTITITFAIGCCLAAAASVFYLLQIPSVTPTLGSMPGIKAFTAAVIGGIGSIPGAMLGGILLGVIEKACLSVPALAPYTTAIEFSMLIIILLVKPIGLLGKKRREKV